MKHLSILLMLSIFANAQVDYQTEIQTIWNQNCVNCHNQSSSNWNQHLLDLSDGVSHGNLMAVSSNYSPANRVVPNDPNQSVLYNKLANTGGYGDVMPPAGQLSSSLIDLVETWIDEGATSGGGGSNGRIEGTITLDEEWVFSQVRMKLTLPGGGFLEQNWGEDPPFSNLVYFFEDPQITEGGPYEIEAYFDANDNNAYEGDEPYVMVDNLYVPASLILSDINLTLVSGGTGGFSFDFGTTSDGANVSNFSFPSGDEITVEMFVKLHTADTFFDMFDINDGGQNDWLLFTYENGRYHFEIENVGSTEWITTPTANIWDHLAADYDGSNLRIYLNGIQMSSSPSSATFSSTTIPLLIGGQMDGLGDVVRISTIARYAGNNFDPWSDAFTPDSDTHLLWHCNEGSGSILNDESGNGFNGSGFGTGTWNDDEPWDGGGGSEPTYIEITSPNSTTNWSTGTGENIEWNSSTSDGMDYTVDIELWKNNSYYTQIEFDFISGSNGGMFYWSIPNSLPDGNDYQIMLWHPDYAVNDYSDYFQISSGGGGDTGKISGDIKVDRAISGNLNLGLYYPGNSPDSGPPDEGPAPEHVNLAGGANWYYEFSNLPDGNGYTVVAFIDADGSANSGPETCDDGEDLQGLTSTINITGGSQENVDVNMDECGGGGTDYPVISNFSVTSGDAYVNSSDVEIYVHLDANSDIAEAKFSYYKGGDYTATTEQDLTLETAGTGDWVGTISANDVTMEGLMIQFYARSNDGYETWSEWLEIPVYFSDYIYNTVNAEEYAMVSFPGDLDSKNVKSVLENDLGSYDPAVWRSFSYNAGSGSYDENSGSFTAGNAFWVISSNSDELYGGSGQVTSLENPYTKSLDQGWNMIGNPYAFNLDISNQVTTTGDVEMTLYSYDGSGYVTKTNMLPGEGYWIWSNEASASLEFNHIPGGGTQKQMTGGWEINLFAVINGFHDSENRLGTHPHATVERDGMDAHEPPVIGDYVQLAFDNSDWTDKGIYSKDIRKEGQTSYTWNIDVKSNIAGQISIEALNTSYIPLEFDAVLIDLENKIQHNIRSSEAYKYVSIGNEQAHQFQVIIGLPVNVSKSIDDLGILPTEFSVNQNVPNPFNPVTAIRLQLAEDAIVSMKVFNILGEEVRTLTNNEYFESGYHQIIWNGRNNLNRQLASGLYLYQTVMKNDKGKLLHINTKKMVLVK